MLALAPDPYAFKVKNPRPERSPAGPLDLKTLWLPVQEAGQRAAFQGPVADREVKNLQRHEEQQDEEQPNPPSVHVLPPRWDRAKLYVSFEHGKGAEASIAIQTIPQSAHRGWTQRHLTSRFARIFERLVTL
jgi:hypothetical protein